jgi:hypothetical protein
VRKNLEETDRIVANLPSVFATWNSDSLFYQFIDSIAQQIREARKEMFQIMRAHWVDTALSEDLDKLGAIYSINRFRGESDSLFRVRIKFAIQHFKSGGTVDSIMSLTSIFLGVTGDQITLIENPPSTLGATFDLKSGDAWEMDSGSINDELPEVTISTVSSDVRFDSAIFDTNSFPLSAYEPGIINLDTGETFQFEGYIGSGQVLKTSKGKVFLDEVDVTNNAVSPSVPRILRKKCRWRYRETMTDLVGIFDAGKFDSSLFRIPVADVTVTLSWPANLVATFDLRLDKKTLSRNSLALADVENFLSQIKAAGVRHIVTVVDDSAAS